MRVRHGETPELPPVAYQIDALAPSILGAANAELLALDSRSGWRTQVFRAILY